MQAGPVPKATPLPAEPCQGQVQLCVCVCLHKVEAGPGRALLSLILNTQISASHDLIHKLSKSLFLPSETHSSTFHASFSQLIPLPFSLLPYLSSFLYPSFPTSLPPFFLFLSFSFPLSCLLSSLSYSIFILTCLLCSLSTQCSLTPG